MISFWCNDAGRELESRARHLLSKTYPNLRWLWSVGDSSDDTETRLRQIAINHDVSFCDSTTHIDKAKYPYRRLSKMQTMTFRHVRDEDDLVFYCESDLLSSPDVIQRLLARGKLPIAGWPTLMHEGHKLFYDTWAYQKNGKRFVHHPPHCDNWSDRVNGLIEVDGFGSAWIAEAADIKDMVIEEECVREICRTLKAMGRCLWVDTNEEIEQPTKLWINSAG